MGKLAKLSDIGQYKRSTTTFRGLNRTEGAQDGEFTDTENLACFHYPVMGTRKGRVPLATYDSLTDLFEWDGHQVIVAGSALYYDGTVLCNVSPWQKQFAVVNTKLVVWPDGIMIDLTNGTYQTMSGKIETAAGTAVLSGDTLTAATVPVIRSNVALNPSVSGSVLEWCPLIYTYGKDRSAIGWTSEGGWTLPTPTAKGMTWPGDGSNSGGVEYPQSENGDILIPTLSGSPTGYAAFAAALGSWTSKGGLTLPDTSKYNTDGYYCVIRGSEGEISIYAGSKSWLVADVYKVGVENVLFSARFSVGDRVTISGTLGGVNDREKIKIAAIDDTKNQITLESAAFTGCFGTLTLDRDVSVEDWAAVSVPTNQSVYLNARFGAVQLKTGDIVRASASENGTMAIIRGGTVIASAAYGTQGSSYTGKRLGQLTAYTGEATSLTIEREIPSLDFICARGNRLYGVSNATTNRIWNSETKSYDTFTSRCLYVSALGLPNRFWDFGGTDADSYQVAVGSNGDFTGIMEFGDYTLFWKEHELVQLYGDYPSNFGYNTMHITGVQKGSHRSQRIINDVLYYKGIDGVYAYALSSPSLISYNLGYRRYTDATAGSDDVHYHISMKDEDGAYDYYVYDTVHGLWVREDASEVKAFSLQGQTLFGAINNTLYALESESATVNGETQNAEAFSWYAVFPAYTESVLERKEYKWLRLRVKLGDGATLKAETSMDGQTYQTVCTAAGEGFKTVSIPLPINRVDRMTVRISGTGEAQLHEMVREYVEGSAWT